MARGTTGAPRNTPGPGPGVPAGGGDTGTAQDQEAQDQEAQDQEARNARAARPAEPGSGEVQLRPGGVGRLIAIVCGRRSKYLVVAFWILVVVALGSLAGKLQGAEKNDASSYLPASAESTQELNEQNLFQSKNLRAPKRGDGGRHTEGGRRRALLRVAARRERAGRPAGGVQRSQGHRDRRRRRSRLQQRPERLRLQPEGHCDQR